MRSDRPTHISTTMFVDSKIFQIRPIYILICTTSPNLTINRDSLSFRIIWHRKTSPLSQNWDITIVVRLSVTTVKWQLENCRIGAWGVPGIYYFAVSLFDPWDGQTLDNCSMIGFVECPCSSFEDRVNNVKQEAHWRDIAILCSCNFVEGAF